MPEIGKISNQQPGSAGALRPGESQISNQVFVVPSKEAGIRLDVWLTRQALACKAPALSRARIQALIHDGHVTVNGQTVKEHHKTRPGDVVALEIPPPVVTALIPEAIPLDILYEDADLIVINKLAGMVVHPAAGHASGTLVNALLHHCAGLTAIGGEQRPGIVHRLDRDTSGIMVAAKSDRALAGLVSQFKQRTIHKDYVALVWGRPSPARGTIETLIGRHRADRKKMSAQPKTGRSAVTHYALMEHVGDVSLIRIRLETGRTHQIRVHMAYRGHPVVGDAQYGGRSTRSPFFARKPCGWPQGEMAFLASPFARIASADKSQGSAKMPRGFHRRLKGYGGQVPRGASLPMPVGRQMLHAETLAFMHPVTGKPLTFTAPWPADLKALVAALRKPEPQPKENQPDGHG